MSSVAKGFDLQGEATPIRELLRDLWASRALVRMLARKDFFVRYRRASFGMLWAVGLPMFQAAVLSLVFSRVVRVETEAPYAAFVFPAYAAWSYFATTLPPASTSIVDNSGLSNKIYFPRAVLPITSVMGNLYGFTFTLVALFGASFAFGGDIGLRLLFVIPGVVLLVSLTASLSLLLSALHVYFRDLRYMVQALMSVWLFMTPVLYGLERAPNGVDILIKANPMTGVVELFRAAMTDEENGWAITVVVTIGWVIVTMVLATLLHRRYNRVFSDLL